MSDGLKGKHIFVIEDEADISHLIRINFELEGAIVSCFDLGESMIEALSKDNIPSLTLLDLMLPNMGGLELCQWIRGHEKFKKIPIIMVTAKCSEENIVPRAKPRS